MNDIIIAIKEMDTQLFLFLNSMHNPFFDEVMYWFSHKFFWIPLYAYFLYLVYEKSKSNTWVVLIFAAMLIVLSDQISVHAFKEVFLRYRPCHNLLIQHKVHLLNDYCGGTYGFVSSHAANTFALAMFLSLYFKDTYKHFGLFIFLWAVLVGYSRIYSGVHYPTDIAVGGIVGMGIGAAIYILYTKTTTVLKINNP
jgi:undecaprenyl-diphosphatase